jgi:hypothetical protein
MKRFLLKIVLIFLPVVFFGQTRLQYHIEWPGMSSQKTLRGTTIYYYTFEGATNIRQFGALPLYHTEFEIPSRYFACEPEINIINSDTLQKSVSAKLSDTDLITTELQYTIEYQDKSAFIYVLPFIKAKDDRIIRINDFNLLIDLVPTEYDPQNINPTPAYADESVLNSGTWYKMGITQTGIHKITFNDLVEIGIDAETVDPEKVGIFGNYDGMLSENNNHSRPDDLQENAIEFVGSEDGKFDAGDYILFYAQAATTWKYNIFSQRFDHSTNLYADTVFYFLTTDRGTNKRIQTIPSLEAEPTASVSTFFDCEVHEEDLENLLYSGREWYGERFGTDTPERYFSFKFPNRNPDRPIYMNFNMASRALVSTYVDVYANGQLVIDSLRFDKISVNSSKYASEKYRKLTFFTENDKLDLKVKYYSDDPTSIGWLNFIELNVERNMIFTGGQMKIVDPRTAAAGNITRFEIDQVNQPVRLWDISNRFNAMAVDYDLTGEKLGFTLATDTLRHFILFDDSQFFQPVDFIPVENQNLHGINNLNFVIISPEKYLEQANRLAKIHEEIDNLKTVVVTPTEIYNEFSSGSQDVTAIRDFMRMLWKKGAFGGDPGYLLLFGDASFDYKHRIHGNTNIVPTYESENSLGETQSYVSDDYFGLLEDDEGLFCRGDLDIGIGRFPISNMEDAVNMVDKVEHYLQRNEKLMKPWRNRICFIADDADHNLHLHQAKYLITTTDTVQPNFNLNKIFSDAYTKVTVPGGKRFPEVNEKIKNQVEEGALIVNYTGHGGLIGWSEESILDVPTIRSFNNLNNMPLFITATCEFSRFDNPEFVSAGEYLFLNPHGGGVALLTTTRLAFAAANIIVNQRIYKNLMQREDGERPRLGDMMRMSKKPSNENFLNFTLLGDPALRLAYPKYDVITSTINNKDASASDADTVHALSLVTISGSIVDQSGNKIQNFSGYVYPKVFDKTSEYMTLGTEIDSSPEEFELMDKILFNGKASVVNGDFSFSFLIPKDISYKYGFGKVSYYALDTNAFVDAWGSYRQLFIGGLDNQYQPDHTGPDITLYFNDKSFSSGDEIPENSYFYADLSDESGIHSTGNSLGRDITLTMDNDLANVMIMNEYYTPAVDSYRSGEVEYLFNGLSDGWHTVTLKAWDLQNNSSEVSVDFFVDKNSDLMLSNVFNYPNPFTDETWFGFTHNKNGAILEVQINIFDLNGRFVTQLNEKVGSSGSKALPIKWNGTNHNGDPMPAGIYTYNIIVTDYTGKQSTQRQKLIKLSD